MPFFTRNTIDGLRDFRNFRGRTSRKNHWLFVLGLFVTYLLTNFTLLLIIRLLIVFPIPVLNVVLSSIATITLFLFMVFFFISYLSSLIRRIHDSGKSGWFYLVPFYNFYLLVRKGDVEANRWGDPN